MNRPGKCVDIDTGEVVGEHMGIHHWNIGQQCLGHYFVVDKDPNNIVFVVSIFIFSRILFINLKNLELLCIILFENCFLREMYKINVYSKCVCVCVGLRILFLEQNIIQNF